MNRIKKFVSEGIKKVNEIKTKASLVMASVLFGVSAMPLSVSASTNGGVAGINMLVEWAGNLVTALGAFVIIWGIFEMGSAMQSHDGAQTTQAGKRIAGGLIMVVAPQILAMFV
ncbi:MAG: hypothetical protein ACK5LL_04675 [Suipraeoptans sp.]